MKFRTRILGTGVNTAGIHVPEEVMEALGSGRRPAVTVTIHHHTYRSSVGTVDGQPMIGVSAANRAAADVAAGDEVEVTVGLDTAPREVIVPDDLARALDADPDARRTFDSLSYSNKRWHVESITGAKTEETRQRRIAKSVAALHDGESR
ncbi:MAG: YdeI/OmpD-associated family protein [Candidatus Limnocylindria bacterium]